MPTKLSVRRPEDFIPFPLEGVFQGIHQRIEQQVLLYSDKIAISTNRLKYTYREMNGLANSLSDAILTAKGTELGQVAILQPNSPDLIISLLASLKAHKAYVPMDGNFPIERLRAMMDDSEADIILTDGKHRPLAEELCKHNATIIEVDGIHLDPDAPNPNLSCDPLDRAYILYTSGTTGKPKGIEFVHRNLLHTTMCLTNELYYSPSDRVTWLHSPSFGSSIVDIYNCLTNGATLFPWDTKTQGFSGMAEWVGQNQLTAFHWVPSAFRQFMRTVSENAVFDGIRIVVMAGETLTIREVDLFRRYFPVGSHLVNQVGTAESYNYYLYRVDHEIPIEEPNVAGGYPVSPDRQLLILDENLAEVRRGEAGEIAIKSNYMAAGYWRNGELTRAKFVHLGDDPDPAYLTGDLGRIDETGCLIHLGRKDFQFKIRGCRVELSEIDNLLLSAPGVQDAITWVAKNRRNEDELVGYIVPKGGMRIDQSAVQEHLSVKLPSYMVPRHFVLMDALPMLPTGKTDRKSLPNPFFDLGPSSTRAIAEGQSIGGQIVSIFRELLQVDEIGLESDFLKEGGDSLLAAVLIHRLRERFNVQLSEGDLPDAPTPKAIAHLIRSRLDRDIDRPDDGKTSAESRRVSKPRMSNLRLSGSIRSGLAERSSPIPNLVIIGAGQSGREIYTWAMQSASGVARLKIKGFLDQKFDALDGYGYDVGVLGTVDTYEIEPGDVFIAAIGNPVSKATCCSRIVERGGSFINIIHPLANIGKNVELGTGIVMAPYTSVTADVQIGSHVSIGTFTNIAHDTTVGDWCQISSHCGLNGTASLGEGAFLGSHACILPSISIGAWAYVGAGSVVVRDVPDGSKVFGNPANVIGRNEARPNQNLAEMLNEFSTPVIGG